MPSSTAGRAAVPRLSILLPDLRGGGAERVCVNLANHWAGTGLNVEMVLMRREGELLAALDPAVAVVDLQAPRPRNLLGPLTRYLRRAQPDAVLANMWPLTILAVVARALARARCRLVVVEHTAWSASAMVARWRTRMSVTLTMRVLLPFADARVAVSDGAARDLERFASLRPCSVQGIGNPVAGLASSSAPSTPPERCLAWGQGTHKRVLAVGTLKAVKGYPTLLRAFALLRQRIDARLLILGEGAERARLETLIDELGLRGSVELPGFEAHPAPFFARADVFVLSSTCEGFGNVIVEALEQGCPVVSTDCPSGPREILAGGAYGRLTPVADAPALAEAIGGSLQSTPDCAALKARAQDYSVHAIARRYLELLLPDANARGRS